MIIANERFQESLLGSVIKTKKALSTIFKNRS